MKQFISGFATCAVICALLFMGSSAIADSPIKLIVNGQLIQCDVPPQIINGRVMVPARFVAEPLGASVVWDEGGRTVIISSPSYQNAFNQSNTTATTIDEEKREVWAKATRTDIVMERAIIKFYDEKNYQEAIDDLKELEHEWLVWGTLDEYNRLKELYLQAIRSLGLNFIHKRSVINGVDVYNNSREVQAYKEFYEGTLNAIQAEIMSLQKKGYWQNY